MNADAIFHSIRLKVPSGSEARDALKALACRFHAAKAAGFLRREQAAAVDPVVTFHAMVASAVMEPPRRLNWHPLALLDFAITGGIILAGGACGWLLIDTMFGFLAW